jgi:hypothetical protein
MFAFSPPVIKKFIKNEIARYKKILCCQYILFLYKKKAKYYFDVLGVKMYL